MSQQELERSDEEVMNMVNGAASPQATYAAEVIAEEFENAKREEERPKEEGMLYRRAKRRDASCVGAAVAACIVVAALCVLALKYSGLVIWLVNAAVLSCGIVAAVKIDRWIRRWRKY